MAAPIALAKATGHGDRVSLWGREWDYHAPPGAIVQHGSEVSYTVGDDGQSWYVDSELDGRDCQRAETATPLHAFPVGKIVDVQFWLKMQFLNMLSRELAYIITGQIQTTNMPEDEPHPPIAEFSWHGQDFSNPKNELVWLKTWSEQDGQLSYGPWPVAPDAYTPFRLRYEPSAGHLMAWIDRKVVFDKRAPFGPIQPREHVFANGLYCGEQGLPVGSGKAIIATYKGVRIA